MLELPLFEWDIDNEANPIPSNGAHNILLKDMQGSLHRLAEVFRGMVIIDKNQP